MRLNALDLVRFLAALSVVMYHYTARTASNSPEILVDVTKFGYLGVPLFFIISGYVISISANNRSAFEFAISRFVRLYPTFWISIAFTIIVTTCVGINNYSVGQILANLMMLNDYLGFENIDGVYWTLQAELKFYACIFLLLLFGIFKKNKIWLSIWLILTMLHLITGQPFCMGWFISPSYSSFFIGGVVFYLIQKNGVNNYNIFVLFSSIIISSYQGFNQTSGFLKNPTIVDQSISVVIIWCFFSIFYLLVTEKVKMSNSKYLVTIGGITYPLYLIHSVAGKAIIDHYRKVYPEGIIVTIVIVAILLFSYFIYITDKKFSSNLKEKLLMLRR